MGRAKRGIVVGLTSACIGVLMLPWTAAAQVDDCASGPTPIGNPDSNPNAGQPMFGPSGYDTLDFN